MALENKLGITSSAELAREEERISKKKAVELFESGTLGKLEPGKFASLQAIHKALFVELKVLLKAVLTDEINSREVYRKGIDHSYYYEGYTTFKAEDLSKE